MGVGGEGGAERHGLELPRALANVDMIEYDRIRSTLKTGDVVLFSGTGEVSEGLKWFQRSWASHVGFVVVAESVDRVLLSEATTGQTEPDATTGEVVRGLSLVGLRDRIDSYRGWAVLRRLNRALSEEQRAEIGSWQREMHGRPYEHGPRGFIQLLRSLRDWGPWNTNAEDFSALFCSENLAGAFQRARVLREDRVASEYIPADFTSRKEDLLFEDGWWLEPEVLLFRQ